MAKESIDASSDILARFNQFVSQAETLSTKGQRASKLHEFIPGIEGLRAKNWSFVKIAKSLEGLGLRVSPAYLAAFMRANAKRSRRKSAASTAIDPGRIALATQSTPAESPAKKIDLSAQSIKRGPKE